MHNTQLFIAAVVSSCMFGTAAGAQSNDCGELQKNGRPGQVYVLSKVGNGQNGSDLRWLPLRGVIDSNGQNLDLQLAYVVPAKHAGDTGALIIKIAQKGVAEPSQQSASNLRVRLFRREVTTTCKGRYYSDYFRSNLVRPEVRTDVSVADYIYYHKTDADSGQDEIYGFHIDYVDRSGNCIATDDKKNGNRQQFLYGNRERDNSLVVANIKDNLGSVARAFGAPGYVEKLLEDKRTRDLLTGYLQYQRLETQLYQYRYPENACIPFAVHDLKKDDLISITFNNLEQRDIRGRLLSAAARKETSVKLHIR